MKAQNNKNLNTFQRLMVIIVPIIVMLLIASVVMCLAFSFLPMSINSIVHTGNVTIYMALGTTLLAVVGIIFSIVSKDKESDKEE
ncbi:MAG: hypothetical protein J1E41_04100 [Ruminococcus sp.]|nr:hypothetical protein [Ruminococcus sp.]